MSRKNPRQAEAEERMRRALKEPTLEGAKRAYARSDPGFWRQLKSMGLRDQVKLQYAEDYAALLAHGHATGMKVAQDKASAEAAERLAAIVEDVRFLVRAGEHPHNIARRVGFNSFRSLERYLNRKGYFTLVTDLYRNDGLGPGPVQERRWR